MHLFNTLQKGYTQTINCISFTHACNSPSKTSLAYSMGLSIAKELCYNVLCDYTIGFLRAEREEQNDSIYLSGGYIATRAG